MDRPEGITDDNAFPTKEHAGTFHGSGFSSHQNETKYHIRGLQGSHDKILCGNATHELIPL